MIWMPLAPSGTSEIMRRKRNSDCSLKSTHTSWYLKLFPFKTDQYPGSRDRPLAPVTCTFSKQHMQPARVKGLQPACACPVPLAGACHRTQSPTHVPLVSVQPNSSGTIPVVLSDLLPTFPMPLSLFLPSWSLAHFILAPPADALSGAQCGHSCPSGCWPVYLPHSSIPCPSG